MAENFVDRVGPPISAAWLNAIDLFYLAATDFDVFIPTLRGATISGSPVYVTQTGWRLVVGSVVMFSIEIAISSKGGATGTVLLEGLPLPVANLTNSYWTAPLAQFSGITLAGGYTLLAGRVDFNTDRVVFIKSGFGLNPTTLDMSEVAASSSFVLSGMYPIA